jgi:hypothetical protein
MDRTQRFFKRIREELKIELPSDVRMRITRAGHWQRSAGAYTSYIWSPSTLLEIGLYEPISKLLKCPALIEDYSKPACTHTIECGCIGKCKGIAPEKKEKK